MAFNGHFITTTSTTPTLFGFNNSSITTTPSSLNKGISTTNSTKEDPFDPSAGEVVELVILFFVCIMTLLGNSLVLLAFMKGPRSIRTHTNYFVVNLAVCDFLVGCLSLPFWICVKLSKYYSNSMLFCFFSSKSFIFILLTFSGREKTVCCLALKRVPWLFL